MHILFCGSIATVEWSDRVRGLCGGSLQRWCGCTVLGVSARTTPAGHGAIDV
eukprot:COSAG04_NODE_32507_length_240_cov_275.397163_1_plen_51_part_01